MKKKATFLVVVLSLLFTLAACPTDPPLTPTGLAVVSATTTTLTLSWDSTEKAKNYELYRDTNVGGSFTTLVYEGSSTECTDDGLTAKTTYYYRVCATNTAGSSGWSNTASATTLSAIAGLYVTDSIANSVQVFAFFAQGDVAPLRTIAGTSTGLDCPIGIAVDPIHAEIFVANVTGGSILVFDADADGNAAPKRTIAGTTTRVEDPFDVALDLVNDEIVIVGRSRIVVHDRAADGDVAPKRVIEGGSTTFWSPETIFVDEEHDEYIAGDTGYNSIIVHARLANGNVAPLRIITGALTGLWAPLGIALDAINEEIIVANISAGTVAVFDRTASGNAAPLRTLTGANVDDIALDAAAAQYIGVDFASSIMVWDRTQTGAAAPVRTVMGAATHLVHPTNVAVVR
jgi:DNA-binding beta-propeller fold protein YncE